MSLINKAFISIIESIFKYKKGAPPLHLGPFHYQQPLRYNFHPQSIKHTISIQNHEAVSFYSIPCGYQVSY
jgi:hypothetical protein